MQELLDRAQEDRAAGLAFSVAVAEFADAAGRESVTLGDGNAPSRREDDGAVTDEPRPTASVPSLEPCGGDLPPCWVAQKESGGSYTAYNPTGCGGRGCYGKWQFSGEWAGKLGLPEDLATATPEQQDAAARELWRNGAGCSNWGACG